jgi:hypothetical protein
VLRFKGLCASQLESDIREACVLGAKHFSDDKAKDKAGDSVLFKQYKVANCRESTDVMISELNKNYPVNFI